MRLALLYVLHLTHEVLEVVGVGAPTGARGRHGDARRTHREGAPTTELPGLAQAFCLP